jgi:hypothetical protein
MLTRDEEDSKERRYVGILLWFIDYKLEQPDWMHKQVRLVVAFRAHL